MNRPRRVLVVTPMTSELKPLLRYSQGAKHEQEGPRKVYTAHLDDVDLVIAQIGIGPARAKTRTAEALDAFGADHVVVSGIAGGLDPAYPVGSTIVPETVLDIASGRRYQASPLGDTTAAGTVGVVDRLITDPKELSDLRALGVMALEMESSGVASACEAAGVPWTVFRVISDRADEGLLDDDVLSFLRPDGTTDPVAAARFLLTHPSRIPRVAGLGRDAAAAADEAARITLRALGWTGGGNRLKALRGRPGARP